MADKIIDLDPKKRISKESLQLMKDVLNDLTLAEVESVTLLIKTKDGNPAVFAYGLDFESIGFAQTVLATLGQDILSTAYSSRKPLDDR